jgi:hypothetical protein
MISWGLSSTRTVLPIEKTSDEKNFSRYGVGLIVSSTNTTLDRSSVLRSLFPKSLNEMAICVILVNQY